jgi:hypothetical protein
MSRILRVEQLTLARQAVASLNRVIEIERDLFGLGQQCAPLEVLRDHLDQIILAIADRYLVRNSKEPNGLNR